MFPHNSQHKKYQFDAVRYLIIFLIIIGLIIVVPNSKLNIKDTLMLALLLVLVVGVVEFGTRIIVKHKNISEQFDGTVKLSDDVIHKLAATADNVKIEPMKNLDTASTYSQSSLEKDVADLMSQVEANPQLRNTLKKILSETSSGEIKEDPNAGVKIYAGEKNADQKEATGSRTVDGLVKDYIPYSDYNHIPLPDNYKPSDFESGYSFLPPEKWYPTPPFPPVCVSEKRCPVCPVFTDGTPVDVKEWRESTKISPPAGINTTFVKEVLNAGR